MMKHPITQVAHVALYYRSKATAYNGLAGTEKARRSPELQKRLHKMAWQAMRRYYINFPISNDRAA